MTQEERRAKVSWQVHRFVLPYVGVLLDFDFGKGPDADCPAPSKFKVIMLALDRSSTRKWLLCAWAGYVSGHICGPRSASALTLTVRSAVLESV